MSTDSKFLLTLVNKIKVEEVKEIPNEGGYPSRSQEVCLKLEEFVEPNSTSEYSCRKLLCHAPGDASADTENIQDKSEPGFSKSEETTCSYSVDPMNKIDPILGIKEEPEEKSGISLELVRLFPDIDEEKLTARSHEHDFSSDDRSENRINHRKALLPAPEVDKSHLLRNSKILGDKIKTDPDQIRLVDVSVVLVDLFSGSLRKAGKAHSNSGSCICMFCTDEYSYVPDSDSKETLNAMNFKPSQSRILGSPAKRDSKLGSQTRKLKDKSGQVKCKDSRKSILAKGVKGKKKPFTCPLCPGSFVSQSSFTFHMNGVHLNHRPFPCTLCSWKFRSNSNLREHMETVHNEERPISCTLCTATFKQARSLKQHMHIHQAERPFACNLCSATFKVKGILTSHLETVHISEKRFSCDICTMKFKDRRMLGTHIRSIHLIGKAFKCKICFMGFYHAATLRAHMQFLHSNERPFKCSVCSKAFKSKSNMNTHMMTHGSERPQKCDLCTAAFKFLSGLQYHKSRYHSDEKRFECDLCKAKYKNKDGVMKHMRVHSADRPFKCELCPATFKHGNSVTHHMKTHNQKGKFRCHLCPTSFNKSRFLKSHMSMHRGGKAFKCSLCTAGFGDVGFLKRHLTMVHQNK